MKNIFLLLFTELLSVSTWAQETVDTSISKSSEIGVGIFFVIFVGFCIGLAWYAWHTWKNESDHQEGDEHS